MVVGVVFGPKPPPDANFIKIGLGDRTLVLQLLIFVLLKVEGDLAQPEPALSLRRNAVPARAVPTCAKVSSPRPKVEGLSCSTRSLLPSFPSPSRRGKGRRRITHIEDQKITDEGGQVKTQETT